MESIKIQVVFVDDHPVLMEGLRSLLVNNMDVEIAGCFINGEGILSYMESHTPDIILLDIALPDMNGIELQRKLIVQGYRLPIIFVTGFSEMRARAQTLAAGAIGFLDKPFSDEELIACLNKALAANGV